MFSFNTIFLILIALAIRVWPQSRVWSLVSVLRFRESNCSTLISSKSDMNGSLSFTMAEQHKHKRWHRPLDSAELNKLHLTGESEWIKMHLPVFSNDCSVCIFNSWASLTHLPSPSCPNVSLEVWTLFKASVRRCLTGGLGLYYFIVNSTGRGIKGRWFLIYRVKPQVVYSTALFLCFHDSIQLGGEVRGHLSVLELQSTNWWPDFLLQDILVEIRIHGSISYCKSSRCWSRKAAPDHHTTTTMWDSLYEHLSMLIV